MDEEDRQEEASATFLAAKERSLKTEEKIAKSPSSFKMITGDRPTGRLHLGHFFGSLKTRVELQNKGLKCAVVIADYQVITDRDTTAHIEDNVLEMVIDYMACGIDPEKTMIFTHSYAPSLNQLMLPFMSLVSEAELARNPTVHAEMLASNHSLTALLLTYLRHPLLLRRRNADGGARGQRQPAAHPDSPDHSQKVQFQVRFRRARFLCARGSPFRRS